MDAIKAAAEMECDALWADAQGNKLEKHLDKCEVCHGTGLKHPTLSRGCEQPDHEDCGRCFDPQEDGHECCGGSGRIPDVTLEKVLDCLKEEGFTSMEFCPLIPGPGWQLGASGAMNAKVVGRTPLEAACAALVAV